MLFFLFVMVEMLLFHFFHMLNILARSRCAGGLIGTKQQWDFTLSAQRIHSNTATPEASFI